MQLPGDVLSGLEKQTNRVKALSEQTSMLVRDPRIEEDRVGQDLDLQRNPLQTRIKTAPGVSLAKKNETSKMDGGCGSDGLQRKDL
ncbi:MAG: hypothetical protein RH862_01270 [Leptospiraceae bacterium]